MTAVSAMALFFLGILIGGLWIIYHMPNRTYCSEHQVNEEMNQKRKVVWSRQLLELNWIDSGMSLILVLITSETKVSWIWFLIALLAVATGIIGFRSVKRAIRFAAEENQIREKYEAYEYDEDDFWYYGITGLSYKNPHDPEVLKTNVHGLNSCINLARPIVWKVSIVIITAISVLMLYIFVYPMILDYRHELAEIRIEKEQVVVEGAFYRKKIGMDTIKSVELIHTKLSGYRTGGVGTANYVTGNFRIEGIGRCKMYLAQKHLPYIMAYTTKGIIIFNDDEEDKTIQCYEELKRLIQFSEVSSKGEINFDYPVRL